MPDPTFTQQYAQMAWQSQDLLRPIGLPGKVGYRVTAEGYWIKAHVGIFDAAIADNLASVSASSLALKAAIDALNQTEVEGNGKLDALKGAVATLGPEVDAQTTAVVANSGKLDALGKKLDTLAAKEQSTLDALGALNANILTLIGLQQAANAAAAQAAAATDREYENTLVSGTPMMIVQAGANGAQLTSVSAAKGDALLALIGGGSAKVTWYYGDSATATLAQGTRIGGIPLSGNNNLSSFLKAGIPAGKFLMVVGNSTGLTFACTVRQL